jgi:hypothetical protein
VVSTKRVTCAHAGVALAFGLHGVFVFSHG